MNAQDNDDYSRRSHWGKPVEGLTTARVWTMISKSKVKKKKKNYSLLGAASGASSVLRGFRVLWAGYVGRVGSRGAGRMTGVLVSALSSRLWPVAFSIPKYDRARASQTSSRPVDPRE